MTESLLTTNVPVFEVGSQVRPELARDVVRLEVAEANDGLRTLSARFVAIGPTLGAAEEQERLQYLDGAVFDFGKPIHVSIGPPENTRTIFRGFISALEAGFEEGEEPEVVVYAEDRLMDLRMTRRMRTYEQVTDADIARAIAAEHALEARVDAEGPTYEQVQQINTSDLAFLRERARLIQVDVWFEDEALHFQTRDRRAGAPITLVRGNELTAVELRADLAHQRTGVVVGGYDARARAALNAEADPSVVRAEAPTGRIGPEVLRRAFGTRVSYRVREVPLTDAQATEWARAELLRRSRQFVQVSGTTSGTPEMTVGSRLTLQRVGAPFEGDGYYVTSVRHTYDLGRGHRTYFDAQRAFIEEAGV